MTYAAILTIEDADLNREVRPQHLQYIQDLFGRGKVRMAGPFGDGSGGLVIYEADSEDEARQLAFQDPIVSSGARTVRLLEWSVLDLTHGHSH